MLMLMDFIGHFSFPELAMFFLPRLLMLISGTVPKGCLGSVGAAGYVQLRDDCEVTRRERMTPDQGIAAAMPQNTIISWANLFVTLSLQPALSGMANSQAFPGGDIAMGNLKMEVSIAAVGLDGWDVEAKVTRGPSRLPTWRTPLPAD